VVVKTLWRALWYPYAWAFPHRSIWSHGPLIGTAIRLAYLSIPTIALSHALGIGLNDVPAWAWRLLPAVVAGLAANDVMHFVMDLRKGSNG